MSGNATNKDDMFDLGIQGLCIAGAIPACLVSKVGQLSYVTVYNYLRHH